MSEPSSPTDVVRCGAVAVVVENVQGEVDVDHVRWAKLAADALNALDAVGELTLTFVDREEIIDLKVTHFGDVGEHPTDVLSFPLDELSSSANGLPVLLGDVVICPSVAAEQAFDHAGTFDDEMALLVVHGVLHILGHDHVEPADTALMQAQELALLESLHWSHGAPSGFAERHREGAR